MHGAFDEISLEELRVLFRVAGISQSDLAIATGIHQSQISRILSGRSGGSSESMHRLCTFLLATSTASPADRVIGSRELIEALAYTWDGSSGQEKALASVIRSLRGLALSPKSSSDKE